MLRDWKSTLEERRTRDDHHRRICVSMRSWDETTQRLQLKLSDYLTAHQSESAWNVLVQRRAITVVDLRNVDDTILEEGEVMKLVTPPVPLINTQAEAIVEALEVKGDMAEVNIFEREMNADVHIMVAEADNASSNEKTFAILQKNTTVLSYG